MHMPAAQYMMNIDEPSLITSPSGDQFTSSQSIGAQQFHESQFAIGDSDYEIVIP